MTGLIYGSALHLGFDSSIPQSNQSERLPANLPNLSVRLDCDKIPILLEPLELDLSNAAESAACRAKVFAKGIRISTSKRTSSMPDVRNLSLNCFKPQSN